MAEFEPIIFLFSAPSGTGKGTLVKQLKAAEKGLNRIVTCTTRPKREGEVEGVSYHFVSKKEFRDMIKKGELIEWNEIYGDYYGTKKDMIDRFIEDASREGKDLILEIDVDGKQNFSKKYDNTVSIFILPPSLEELKERIWGRSAETEQQMEKRFARAKEEIARKDSYDYIVINDTMERAVARLRSIVLQEQKRHRLEV